MQKNWIGKSLGCEIDFEVEGSNEKLESLLLAQILYLELLLSHCL